MIKGRWEDKEECVSMGKGKKRVGKDMGNVRILKWQEIVKGRERWRGS